VMGERSPFSRFAGEGGAKRRMRADAAASVAPPAPMARALIRPVGHLLPSSAWEKGDMLCQIT
jgi:hypothetical protein